MKKDVGGALSVRRPHGLRTASRASGAQYNTVSNTKSGDGQTASPPVGEVRGSAWPIAR